VNASTQKLGERWANDDLWLPDPRQIAESRSDVNPLREISAPENWFGSDELSPYDLQRGGACR
jgi:hypothetical protein